jgi:hypothetical protein
MESEAPPVPVSSLLQLATTLETKASFDWEEVEDISGVTYTFQVAADADFTTIVLEKSGLTEPSYTITEEAKLEATEEENPYYWRIKAVDGAFNESEWTSSGSLYVVAPSRTSIQRWDTGIWALGICVVIGIVGLTLLVYAFRR